MRGQHYPRQARMEATARMHAQGQKRSRRAPLPMTPERIAVHECNQQISAIRSSGQTVPAELHSRYSELLKAYHATL